MENQNDLLAALEYVRAGNLTYDEWTAVGMGLKEAGLPCSVWDDWSALDSQRYHKGECARKWETFRGASGAPITENSIFKMAYDRGWSGPVGHELNWDDEISASHSETIVDRRWVKGRELHIPEHWDPARQLIEYLETLFEPTENVGFVTASWMRDGRYLPTQGCWDRTAGQLIEALTHCGGDIGAVVGDYDPEAGAWIRFNPLDG